MQGGAERPIIVAVHNLGAGGNTPPFWEPPPRGLGHRHVMFNAYFLREHHTKDSISPSITAWVDSGGFLYIRDKTRLLAGKHGRGSGGVTPPEPDEELVETVLRRQEAFGADIAFTLDYPLHGSEGEEVLRRLRVTAVNAALAYQLRSRNSMRLLVVLHYRSASELERLLSMLRAELRSRAGLRLNEVDGFAVGGLVPYRGNLRYLVEKILEARRLLPRGSWLHVLGVASPVNTPLLYAAGADSLDSKTYIIAAAKRLWYTPPQLYLRGWPARLEARRDGVRPNMLCNCPACARTSSLEDFRRDTRLLALHNLHVTLESARLAGADLKRLLAALAERNPRVARAVEVLAGAAGKGKPGVRLQL